LEMALDKKNRSLLNLLVLFLILFVLL